MRAIADEHFLDLKSRTDRERVMALVAKKWPHLIPRYGSAAAPPGSR